ncbi:hypothetical protein [Hydrotalea sp.]|uniref:hypothetical protein n=1 Tax=Hydrotalea sp. TaxID=2881279 RepID=UPI00258E1B0C|nr:hypothetical protein [Hydrotalea sp.]
MINDVLEIKFSGWSSTPRMPFILSGNALCLPTPTYSLLLGIIGCCLGRLINPNEVKVGFYYEYEGIANDLETRQRLELDGKKVKSHSKGTDAYLREFHVSPKLTLWIDRLDWKEYFINPVGTPTLGRSQDLLKIEKVTEVAVMQVEETILSGCMLPFNGSLKIGGQLVQLAEAYVENDEVGSGRSATKSVIFMAVSHENKAKIKYHNLYRIKGNDEIGFYLHSFQ